MSLLEDVDRLLDEAVRLGRLDLGPRLDPRTAEIFRFCMNYAGPDLLGKPVYLGVVHVPPRPKAGVQMSVLAMDRETRRRLYGEIVKIGMAVYGPPPSFGGRCIEYCGVPIKIDPRAAGRIYLVSLKREAA